MEQIEKESESIHEHVKTFIRPRDEYCKNEDIFRHYRFSLVMENKARIGYMTEKILEAFQAGSIPIYWGGNYSHLIFNPKVIFILLLFYCNFFFL